MASSPMKSSHLQCLETSPFISFPEEHVAECFVLVTWCHPQITCALTVESTEEGELGEEAQRGSEPACAH